MTVREFAEKLNLTPISLPDGEREITGFYAGDLLSWVMSRASADDVWFTIMSNVNVLAVASLIDVAAVVLTEGVMLSDEDKASAEAKGINVLAGNASTYELCALAGAL